MTERPVLPSPSTTRSQILAHLVSDADLCRRDLVERLRVSPATVSTQVRRLLEKGVLEEGPSVVLGSGRPRVPLRIVPNAGRLLGVSVQSDSIIMVELRLDGSVVEEVEFEIEEASPESLADALARHVRAGGADRERIPHWGMGVAISGVVLEEEGLVAMSVLHGWKNVSVGNLLAQALGMRVRVVNDIASLASRELFRTAVEKPRDFLLAVAGDGIGMAIIRGSEVVMGDDGASAEMGHVSVDPMGPTCRCGNNGCIQALAGLRELRTSVEGSSGTEVPDVPTLLALADRDQRVSRTLDRAGFWLGRAVGGACTMLGLRSVLLSGESLPLWDHMATGFHVGLRETTRALTNEPIVQLRPWRREDVAIGAATLLMSHEL